MAETVQIYEGAMDRGLEGVVACSTAISSIVDATLCFRGYTIEDLAAHSNYEETIYLLWNNRLPNKEEYAAFCKTLSSELALDPSMIPALKALPTKDVHPMAWLRTAASLLSLYDNEAQDMATEANMRKAIRMTAKMTTLVAAFERIRNGKDLIQPDPKQRIAWNFFYMMTGKQPDAELVRELDVCLVLHADHELNCSAFAARVSASSLSDIYSAVVSAIGALKGPLHGGANEAVMRMLLDIDTMDRAKVWVEEALQNKQKVMGFGHRVYKHGDPRAKVLMSQSKSLTKKFGRPELYEMSEMIDKVMQSEKGLLPNVDFYSATVYHSMGIAIDLFTPVFAMSRVSGWLAHIMEQWQNNRIYRPRGHWTGKEGLVWQPVDKR
jgi:citrate synthase